MLKIKLNNPDAAQPVITHLRQAILNNCSFVVGLVNENTCYDLRQICKTMGLITHFVTGRTGYNETYYGVIVSTEGPLESGPTDMIELDCYFSEKPFKFLSREDATKVWPHETLEDRVIDVCLAAITGFAVPTSAELFEPGEKA